MLSRRFGEGEVEESLANVRVSLASSGPGNRSVDPLHVCRVDSLLHEASPCSRIVLRRLRRNHIAQDMSKKTKMTQATIKTMIQARIRFVDVFAAVADLGVDVFAPDSVDSTLMLLGKTDLLEGAETLRTSVTEGINTVSVAPSEVITLEPVALLAEDGAGEVVRCAVDPV